MSKILKNKRSKSRNSHGINIKKSRIKPMENAENSPRKNTEKIIEQSFYKNRPGMLEI